MKNVVIIIFVALIVIVLATLLFTFQVRETQSALVMTFGSPTRQLPDPGLYFRWPVPIQRVYKFDSRLQVLITESIETATKGQDPIIISSYLVWKIEKPLEFKNNVNTVKEAQRILLSRLKSTQSEVLGQYYFSQIVNNDPEKIMIDQIQQDILDQLKDKALNDYGIEIAALGIKQLSVDKEITKNVFDRMKSERTRKTKKILAQGVAESNRIRGNADATKQALLDAAEARAKAIRGQGDAEAAKYYGMLKEDPQFAMFLRKIEALKKTFEKDTTIVLNSEMDIVKFLKEAPSIEPAK